MKNKASSTSRAGSHAGRGFRYQDAVGALLAIEIICGKRPSALAIPEGVVKGNHDLFNIEQRLKSLSAKIAPIDERLVAQLLESWSGFEVSLMLKKVMKLGLNGYEFL